MHVVCMWCACDVHVMCLLGMYPMMIRWLHNTGAQTFYRVAKCYVGEDEKSLGGLKDKTTVIAFLVNVFQEFL